jgi:hypothetical protein
LGNNRADDTVYYYEEHGENDKNEPKGIDMLLPWSDFIKERCTGLIDTETINPENRGALPI